MLIQPFQTKKHDEAKGKENPTGDALRVRVRLMMVRFSVVLAGVVKFARSYVVSVLYAHDVIRCCYVTGNIRRCGGVVQVGYVRPVGRVCYVKGVKNGKARNVGTSRFEFKAVASLVAGFGDFRRLLSSVFSVAYAKNEGKMQGLADVYTLGSGVRALAIYQADDAARPLRCSGESSRGFRGFKGGSSKHGQQKVVGQSVGTLLEGDAAFVRRVYFKGVTAMLFSKVKFGWFIHFELWKYPRFAVKTFVRLDGDADETYEYYSESEARMHARNLVESNLYRDARGAHFCRIYKDGEEIDCLHATGEKVYSFVVKVRSVTK